MFASIREPTMDFTLSEFISDFVRPNQIAFKYIKVLDDVYRFIYEIKFLSWIRLLLKIIFIIIIAILVIPIAYILLVFFLKKSNATIAKLHLILPELSIKDLEELKGKFNQIEIKYGLSQDYRIETKNTPFILKPILFSLKENVDQYFELKKSIDEQIESDLHLFSLGLESDEPITSAV